MTEEGLCGLMSGKLRGTYATHTRSEDVSGLCSNSVTDVMSKWQLLAHILIN